MRQIRSLLGFLLLSHLTGCASNSVSPDVAAIYNQTAQIHESDRNPVIVIPGILGSNLRDAVSGQIVWGAFDSYSADPETAAGARLVALAPQEDLPLNSIPTTVEPAGVLDRVKLSLWGLPVELQAYAAILSTLGAGGFRDESLAKAGAIDYGDGHFTCFQFAYDWRRDISYNSVLLEKFIRERKRYVEGELLKRYGVRRDVKFDIVAHSMGGLLARYFVQHGGVELPEDGSLPAVNWQGADLIENVILVGTPNAGSILSFKQLIEGVDYGAFVPKYEKAILGTMPAVYELLPRARHGAYVSASTGKSFDLDIFDHTVWERFNWGLADPEQDQVLMRLLPDVSSQEVRRRIALDQLRKSLFRARQFHQSMDRVVTPPATVKFSLYVGDAMPTLSQAKIDTVNGKVEFSAQVPGDGTVTRQSVLMDERTPSSWTPMLRSPVPWKNVTFLFTDHIGMTKDPAFSDNILFSLLEHRT